MSKFRMAACVLLIAGCTNQVKPGPAPAMAPPTVSAEPAPVPMQVDATAAALADDTRIAIPDAAPVEPMADDPAASAPMAAPRSTPPPAVRTPPSDVAAADRKRAAAPKPPAPPAPEKTQQPEPPAVVAKAGDTSTISGRLHLSAGTRQTVAGGEDVDGLVYFLPKSGSARGKPGRFSIDTRSKGFSPSLLVVPMGSTVAFPNRDTILHNVYSRTPGSTFELGTYGPGETKQYVFGKSGLVIVGCNVHNNMRANVVVLETRYFTRPDRNGNFHLDNLPPGPGTLVFWHPRADAQTMAVTLPATAAVNRTLVATRAPIDMPMTMKMGR